MIYSGSMTVSAPTHGAALFAALLGIFLAIAPGGDGRPDERKGADRDSVLRPPTGGTAPAAAQGTSPEPPVSPAGLSVPPGEPDEEAVFLSVIEDIPLMPGLVEDETRAIVFDAAGGRLAETYAQGRLAPAAVLEFYGETLPALGWDADGDSRWVREGEALTLEIKEGASGIDVRFSLSPAAVMPLGMPSHGGGISNERGRAPARVR
jgi:hypothetical protein